MFPLAAVPRRLQTHKPRNLHIDRVTGAMMEQIPELDSGPLITQSKPLIESSTNTKQIDFGKGKSTLKYGWTGWMIRQDFIILMKMCFYVCLVTFLSTEFWILFVLEDFVIFIQHQHNSMLKLLTGTNAKFLWKNYRRHCDWDVGVAGAGRAVAAEYYEYNNPTKPVLPASLSLLMLTRINRTAVKMSWINFMSNPWVLT